MPALELPRLRGDVVRLRAFTAADVAVVLDAATDDYIRATTTVPAPGDEAAALAFIDRQHERAATGTGYSFAVTDHDDVAVGQLGLWLRDLDRGRVSVGYWIAPAARRRGYAVDALRVASHWGAHLPGVHRLELHVEPWNVGSCRTAEGAGYQREGLLRSWERIGSRRRDMWLYARVADG